MRVTLRYWSAVALGGFLAAFAAVLSTPVLLVGAGGVGAWLVAAQYRFVRESTRTVDSLTVEQRCSRGRVVTDEPFTVTLGATLSRPSTLDLAVELRPPVSVAGLSAAGRTCHIDAGGREATTTADCRGTVAGRLDFSPPSVTLTDPLGLFAETVVRGPNESLEIGPRTPHDVHVGTGGERIQTGYGEHPTAQHGTGIESADLRPYVHGDDLSRIDWKATARLDDLHIREYEVNTARQTALLVDHGASMADGPDGERKLDYAREIALAFVRRAHSDDDPLALYAADDGGVTVEIAPGAREQHYLRIRRRLYDLEAGDRGRSRRESDTAGLPSTARRLARRFEGGSTTFERTLRPYLQSTTRYVRRLESRPLFSSVRLHVRDLQRPFVLVVLTDDTDRAEVHEAAKLDRRDGGHVLVFLTPTVLFEEGALSDLESAYRRYREFEAFRRRLAGLDRVSAFEVAPGDRIAPILDVRRSARRSSGSPSSPQGGVLSRE
ncbi:MAG: DUF58 domain-containing protein [Salinigranum sp.]